MPHDRHAKAHERLTFFSDAIFAIAMTLLVIEIHLPHLSSLSNAALGEALLSLSPNYVGFLISFLVIGRFWLGHHRNLSMVETATPRVNRFNLAFLLCIAFIPFPTAVVSDYIQLSGAVAFYAIWLLITGTANLLLVLAVFRDRDTLYADVDERDIAVAKHNCGIPIAVGTVALVGSLISPIVGIVSLTVVGPLAGMLGARLSNRFPAPESMRADGDAPVGA